MDQAQHEAHDEAVAELDDSAFKQLAQVVTEALIAGSGLRVNFQPGDATRYQLEISPTRTVDISNDLPTRGGVNPAIYAWIKFGTVSDIAEGSLLRPDNLANRHPWTAAVWRRIATELTKGN